MTRDFSIRMFTLVILFCLGSLFESGSGQHTNATLKKFERELLDLRCPKVDICNPNATSADLQPKGIIGFGFVSCCSGCSCHPDCEEQKNCCFHDDSKPSEDDGPNTLECVSTRLVPPGVIRQGDVPSYKTVVTPPSDGCVRSKPVKIGPGQVYLPTCDNTYLPAFESYYPVYSAKTGLIYKNILCAICHGAMQLTQFKPELICKKTPKLFEELAFFVTGILPSNCVVDFLFGDRAIISTHKCYKEIVNTCETDEIKFVPHGYSGIQTLDIEIVRSLCENGIYSPTPMHTRVYRNAFCLICASALIKINKCRFNGLSDRGLGGSLIHIMDDRKLIAQLSTPTEKKRNPDVCLPSKEPKVERSCRSLFCSSGKLRNSDGECEFITTLWKNGFNYVEILLSPVVIEGSFYETTQMDSSQRIIQAFEEGTPWSNIWEIVKIERRDEQLRCKEGVFKVTLETGTDDVVELYKEMKTSLKTQWPIKMNGSIEAYRQSWLKMPSNPNGCEPLESTFKGYFSIGQPRGEYIKKLFLCEQVELKSGEFEIRSDVLYSNLTLRDMHWTEYELNQGDRVRVCLGDTIFKPPQTGLGWQTSASMTNIVVSLIIVISALQ